MSAPRLVEFETSFSALARESHDLQAGASVMMGLNLGIILVGLWQASGLDALGDLSGAGQPARRSASASSSSCTIARALSIDAFTRASSASPALRTCTTACAGSLGATPLSLIHDRLMEEACRRLEQTQLSVEQIGYSLGFRDPAYFNRFFKRQAGLAPGAYRKAARGRAATRTPSFAAWP